MLINDSEYTTTKRNLVSFTQFSRFQTWFLTRAYRTISFELISFEATLRSILDNLIVMELVGAPSIVLEDEDFILKTGFLMAGRKNNKSSWKVIFIHPVIHWVNFSQRYRFLVSR